MEGRAHDKLEIPEAAVEAMLLAKYGPRLWPTGDASKDEMARFAARQALAAALPHMPDRGYAEGIEAAAKWHDDQQQEERGPDYGMASEIDRATWRTYNRMHANSAATIRALAPPAPADNGEPATHDEESILDVISGNLRMESWVAGKTLTVMFDAESGERRFAKLRLTKIAAQPSPADLKGEPE